MPQEASNYESSIGAPLMIFKPVLPRFCFSKEAISHQVFLNRCSRLQKQLLQALPRPATHTATFPLLWGALGFHDPKIQPQQQPPNPYCSASLSTKDSILLWGIVGLSEVLGW